MAVARSLRRLLRVLELEEEQASHALESAMEELRRLESAFRSNREREQRGRALVRASAHSGDLADRLAGLEEARLATRWAAALAVRIAEADERAAQRRQQFLAKRVERRQAETLIEEAEARHAEAAGRRSQQSVDDWYLNRMRRGQEPAKGKNAEKLEEKSK